MNQDSACEKYVFPGKSGTNISTIPCKDPRAPKRRRPKAVFTAMILAIGAAIGAKAAAGTAATTLVIAGTSGLIIGATT